MQRPHSLTLLTIFVTTAGFGWNIYAIHCNRIAGHRSLPMASEMIHWVASTWPISAFILGAALNTEVVVVWAKTHPRWAAWAAMGLLGHCLWPI